MRHFLLMGRQAPQPTFSEANSSLLGTVPYALTHERATPLDDASGKMTFSAWVYRETVPATKYVLARIEANDAANYVEISIVPGNRLRAVIGERGRATAIYMSPINSLPIDAYYRHVCVTVDTSQAQEARRVTFAIDGTERLSSMVNPPAYLANLSAVGLNSSISLMGTADAVTQLNGEMALAYLIFGRALDQHYFVLSSGTSIRTRPFTAAQGDGDIYLPLADDFVDDFNGVSFSLIA